MSHGIRLHPPWCAEDCAAAVTGVHTSRPVPVASEGTELVGITVALEQLAETPPVALVVLEFVQDDAAIRYRLRIGQVRTLQCALQRVSRRLAAA